jgi:hypothetical protein
VCFSNKGGRGKIAAGSNQRFDRIERKRHIRR